MHRILLSVLCVCVCILILNMVIQHNWKHEYSLWHKLWIYDAKLCVSMNRWSKLHFELLQFFASNVNKYIVIACKMQQMLSLTYSLIGRCVFHKIFNGIPQTMGLFKHNVCIIWFAFKIILRKCIETNCYCYCCGEFSLVTCVGSYKTFKTWLQTMIWNCVLFSFCVCTSPSHFVTFCYVTNFSHIIRIIIV